MHTHPEMYMQGFLGFFVVLLVRDRWQAATHKMDRKWKISRQDEWNFSKLTSVSSNHPSCIRLLKGAA